MAGWQVGLVIMMAVGVAVILFGALWDRERNRRRAELLSQPPARPVPGHSGGDPVYVIRPPANTPTAGSHILSDTQRAGLAARLETTTALAAPLAAPELITDAESGWAVLEHPRVLICAEPVMSFRELLPLLGREPTAPLVVVAPGFDDKTLDTLVINHLHRMLRVIAVTADADTATALAEATGATALSRIDMQAGWVPDDAAGTVVTWVSSLDGTWVLADPRPSGGT